MGKKNHRRDKNKYFKKTNVEMINEEFTWLKILLRVIKLHRAGAIPVSVGLNESMGGGGQK